MKITNVIQEIIAATGTIPKSFRNEINNVNGKYDFRTAKKPYCTLHTQSITFIVRLMHSIIQT